ncbi:hypothetical protein EOL70_00625 [Leucothrix sargassi]|nr:hypothetical protein EOL70_00625 [Leucothrix sargassi]
MPIRRIKAHRAVQEGDKVKITTESDRLPCIIICLLIAFVAIFFINKPDEPLLNLGVLGMGFLLGLLFGSSQVDREVPLADVVEIKRYDWPERVTVVLDDERSRMARPGGQPPKPAT